MAARDRSTQKRTARPVRKSGRDSGIRGAAADLGTALLARRRERLIAERLGAPEFFRQVVVRLLRVLVERDAKVRGVWRMERGVATAWLFSRDAAPEFHATPLARAVVACVLEATKEMQPDSLGDLYESLLACEPAIDRGGLKLDTSAASARKRGGSYFTPARVVERLLDLALTRAIGAARRRDGRAGILALRVCDPACGAGNFLVAALDRIAGAAARSAGRDAATSADRSAAVCCVRGMDVDPIAAELCRLALWFKVGDPRLSPETIRIETGEALLADWAAIFPDVEASGGFDAVVGNPPFLSQLSTATAHERTRAAAIKSRFGAAAGAFTDPAALFLLLGTRLARRGGRVSLLQPVSILASRDASGVRRAALAGAAMESFWGTPERVFDAGVTVCAPVLRMGVPQRAVKIEIGEHERREIEAVELDAAGTWAPLLAELIGVPPLRVRAAGVLGDIAAATADFRDQYYGLRGLVVEDAALNGQPRERFAPLITSGLISAGVCRWGAAPTRFGGQPFAAPRVDLDGLEAQTTLASWARARLIPKILLATQTPVLEAVVDEGGEWLPSVPVITVTPRPGAGLWTIAAVLLSPVASAWALRRYGGAGLSLRAIKLSARQVQEIPRPVDRDAWSAAALAVERVGSAAPTEQTALLTEAARLMCDAYAVPEPGSLVNWWAQRAGLVPRVP